MRVLLPVQRPVESPAELADLYAFPATHGRAWVRAVFVSSADGSAQGEAGVSGSLSGPADRRVFAIQRSLCDVVLVGAGTARAEGYRPVRPDEVDAVLRQRLGLAAIPPIAVVSGSLDLDPALLGSAAAPTIVVTTEDAAEPVTPPSATTPVVRAGRGRVDVGAALTALAARGLTRVVCEGGPTLLGGLAESGRLDELCLSLSPLLVGAVGSRILVGPALAPPARLRLAHLLEDDGTLFARYLVERSAPSTSARS